MPAEAPDARRFRLPPAIGVLKLVVTKWFCDIDFETGFETPKPGQSSAASRCRLEVSKTIVFDTRQVISISRCAGPWFPRYCPTSFRATGTGWFGTC